MRMRNQRISKFGRKKRKKWFTLKRMLLLALTLLVAYIALFLIVVPERPNHAFFSGSQHPMIIAYQGGASLAPKNTLVAFEKAKSLGVDAIHFEVRMSQDGHLVVIGDDRVDETTDGEGKVSEMSLAQLKELDAAYRFTDLRSNYVYRGQNVKIPTVEEVFKQFRDMRFVIEMIEPPKSEENTEAFDMAKQLWDLIVAHNMQKKVLVSADTAALIQNFNTYAQNQVVLAASNQEATRFALLHKIFLNRLYRPNSDVFQVSPQLGIFNMRDGRMIDGAHRLNMRVHYTKISDEATMRDLLRRGADGIITDRPDLLIRVMNEMGLNDEQD